jgi:hypothetical protein
MQSISTPIAGRVLALNPEKARRFQCGGFWLSFRQSYARVPQEAQFSPIRAALADGRLIDITDQLESYKKGGSIVVHGSEIGPAADLGDTGKKVYFLRKDGTTCALIPETPEQGEELERQAVRGKPLVLPPGMDNPDRYLIRLDLLPEVPLA